MTKRKAIVAAGVALVLAAWLALYTLVSLAFIYESVTSYLGWSDYKPPLITDMLYLMGLPVIVAMAWLTYIAILAVLYDAIKWWWRAKP